MKGLGATLAFLPLLLHACGACTGGWHSFHHGGPCFKIYHESGLSWNLAQTRCREHGAVLAQVPDSSTHHHLIDLISKDHGSGFFMIGANNRHHDDVYRWTSLGGHLTSSHSYWLSGQPDNYCRQGTTCHEGQHCVAYTDKNSDHWGWDDITCSYGGYNYYICEKGADGGPLVG